MYGNYKYEPKLTSDEITALSLYKGEYSVSVNSILNDGYNTELSYKYGDDVNPFTSLGIKNPEKCMNIICNLYSAIYKMSKQRMMSERRN